MQRGSFAMKSRIDGPDVWQLRWSEKGPNSKRVYRKRVIGTLDEYPDLDAARSASLITEVNWANLRSTSIVRTVAQLCRHFEITGTLPQQHLAQLFHEDVLRRLPTSMHHNSLIEYTCFDFLSHDFYHSVMLRPPAQT